MAQRQKETANNPTKRQGNISVTPRAAKPRSQSSDGPQRSPRDQEPKASRAPASIESEQRAITVVASQTHMAVKDFRSTYNTGNVDLNVLKNTAYDVLQSLHVNALEVDNAKDYLDITKENGHKLDQNIKKRPEYEQLDMYSKKGVKFQSMVPPLKQKIKLTIRDHLEKYCLSFHEEPGATEVKSVNEYESKIQKHKEILHTKQQALDRSWTEYQEMKCPFIEGYLTYQIGKKMDEVCSCLTDLADTMRRWAHQDRMYPARLWEEIIAIRGQRGRGTDHLKSNQRKREVLQHQVHKREIVRDRIRTKLEDDKRERKKVQQSKEVVQEQLEKSEKEQQENKEKLKENEMMINHRKYNSPMFLDKLCNKSEWLRAEDSRIGERVEAYRRQLARYEVNEKEYDGKIKELEGELAEENYEIKERKDQIEILDKESNQIERDLESRKTKTETAKRIRELKLNATTIRKIYFQRLDTQEDQDDLSEACRLVSRRIGNNWRGLYNTLPFRPHRDQHRRQNDIEKVYVTCLHRDATLSEQAFQSLLKWRVFNRQKRMHTNMTQLTKALRKIQKDSIARQIENRYLKAQSV